MFVAILKHFNYTKKKQDNKPAVVTHESISESSTTSVEDIHSSATVVSTNYTPTPNTTPNSLQLYLVIQY